ncbi:hypothetical protein [Bacillus cereus]|uniref:hypothetical protein n=1 Tax=Bacillus cereus TaxID=1396 RepID=UPI0018A75E65|nr:hypothetical protein [Bacillus cereus]MBF8118126.1 hypothetical protein [Bacillus cereus]
MTFVKYYSIEEVARSLVMNYFEKEDYKELQIDCDVKIVRYGREAEFRLEAYPSKSPENIYAAHEHRVNVIEELGNFKIASKTAYSKDHELIEVINVLSGVDIVVEKETDKVLEKLQSNIEQGLVTKEEVQREECGQRWIPLLNENKYTELIKSMEEDYKKGKIGEQDYKTVVAEIRSMRLNKLFN